ncbi:MAG: response regulator transcription factor [Beijerinckiaceae bacterium]
MLNAARTTNEVFVVDDDPAVRDALSMALRAEGYQVEAFQDARALLDIVRLRAPAAIVLDVMLPDQSGLDILKQLKSEAYPAPIVLISGHGDIPMAVEGIKLGAFDFIEKPFSMDALLNQLKSAISAQARREQAGSSDIDLGHIGGSQLTPREREVLREIATGASSKEAGRILGISPRTVEVHRARIMDKLGARNAADLMRIIFSHGS